MDVGVDETGHDEQAGVIVDDRAWRGARQDVARFADRLDQPARTRTAPSSMRE